MTRLLVVAQQVNVEICSAEKEGKAVHLSYHQKCQLVAYTQQVAHGRFVPEVHGVVGVLDLDLVGKDRKLAWQKLGDLSKVAAMDGFVSVLDGLCPQLRPYVEAQKKDLEIQAQRQLEAEERARLEEEQQLLDAEEERRLKAEMERQEEKRRQIKEALNTQTYSQFKAYATQQYPENPDQQAVLIRQLQEQHYIQYMQQIFQQQLSTQSVQTATAQVGLPSSELPVDVEAAALQALADIQNFPVDSNQDQYSEGSGNDLEQEGEAVLITGYIF